MEKRLLLAILLSTLVILTFNWLEAQKRQDAEKLVSQKQASKTPVGVTPEATATVSRSVVSDATSETEKTVEKAVVEAATREFAAGPEKNIRIRSELYEVILNTRGARVTSWRLLQYPEEPYEPPRLMALKLEQMERAVPKELTLEQAERELSERQLLYFKAYLKMKERLEEAERFQEAQGTRERPLPSELAVELVPQDGPKPIGTLFLEKRGEPLDMKMVYRCDESDIVVDSTRTVTFSVQTDKMRFQKSLTFFPDRYDCQFETEVTMLEGEEETDQGTLQLVMTNSLGRYLTPAKSGRFAGIRSALVQVGGKVRKTVQPSQKMGFEKYYSGNIDWVGMDSRYFLGALVPQFPVEQVRIVTREVPGTVDVMLNLPLNYMERGTHRKFELSLFMGPKDTDLLAKLGKGIEQTVFSVGLLRLLRLSWICPLLLSILKSLYLVIPNYGVGILLLSLLARMVTYPLTVKQLRSMKHMQELAPQVKEIRERLKDNPKELQKKTMELYRQHGVNPMGGCWPMLLQLPIFIGLFMTLNYSIQLRGEPFFLWITDLSKPDALAYLPFQLPIFGFVTLNMLPLVMGTITYLQQKKQAMDPQQATMAKMMPIIFTLICWNFPSGVVLYWTVSSLLQGVQQRFLNQPGKEG